MTTTLELTAKNDTEVSWNVQRFFLPIEMLQMLPFPAKLW